MKYSIQKSLFKVTSGFILLAFLAGQILIPSIGLAADGLGTPSDVASSVAQAQVLPNLTETLGLSSVYAPPVLLGLKVHPENPLLFDFIVDRGQTKLSDEEFKAETQKLVEYFFAALTIPHKEAWVNLSPYEKDRIIPDVLGKTQMGKTMLEQDYVLKQLAASLTNPETDLGKKYWASVGNARERSIQNKVWIVPSRAKVLESNGIVVVDEKRLKVMMVEDYDAQMSSLRKQGSTFDNQEKMDSRFRGNDNISSQIFRQTILPTIEKEVNESKDFAAVRQVYNSVILAAWYKQALKESLLGKVYTDKAKVSGIETDDKEMKQRIYQQYLAAFKKGAYNFIKEEEDADGDLIPRKYFSGGALLALNVLGSARLEVQEVSSDAVKGTIDGASSAVLVTVQGDEPNAVNTVKKLAVALAAGAVLLTGAPNVDAQSGATETPVSVQSTVPGKADLVPLNPATITAFNNNVKSFWDNHYMSSELDFNNAHGVVRLQLTQSILSNPGLLDPANFGQTGLGWRQMYDILSVSVVDLNGNDTGVAQVIKQQYPNTSYSLMAQDALQVRLIGIGYGKEMKTPADINNYFTTTGVLPLVQSYQQMLAQSNISPGEREVILERLAYIADQVAEKRMHLNSDNSTPVARAAFDVVKNGLIEQLVKTAPETWLSAYLNIGQMNRDMPADPALAFEKLNNQLAQYESFVNETYSVHQWADHAYGRWTVVDRKIITDAAEILGDIHKQAPLADEQLETMLSRLWKTAQSLDNLSQVQSPDRQSDISEALASRISRANLLTKEKALGISQDQSHPLNQLALAILRIDSEQAPTTAGQENVKTGFLALVELYFKNTPAGSQSQSDVLNWVRQDSQGIIAEINSSPESFEKITQGWAAEDFYLLLVESANTARLTTQKKIVRSFLESNGLSGYEFLRDVVRWHKTNEFIIRVAQSGELNEFLNNLDPQNKNPQALLELAYQMLNGLDENGNRAGQQIIVQLNKVLQNTSQGNALLTELNRQAKSRNDKGAPSASSALSEYLFSSDDPIVRGAVKSLAEQLFKESVFINDLQIVDFRLSVYFLTAFLPTIPARELIINLLSPESESNVVDKMISEALLIAANSYDRIFTENRLIPVLDSLLEYTRQFKETERYPIYNEQFRGSHFLAVRFMASHLVIRDVNLGEFITLADTVNRNISAIAATHTTISRYLDTLEVQDKFIIDTIREALPVSFLESQHWDEFNYILHDVRSFLAKKHMESVIFRNRGSVGSSAITPKQINDAANTIVSTLTKITGNILKLPLRNQESLRKLIVVLLTQALGPSNVSNPNASQVNYWVQKAQIANELKSSFATAQGFLSPQEIMTEYLGYQFENGTVSVVPQVILQEIKRLTESTPSIANLTEEPQKVGGINFDPTLLNLQIKRDGRGVPLPLLEQNIENINIEGLFPIIINIQPVNAQTLPLFLGKVIENSVNLPKNMVKDSS